MSLFIIRFFLVWINGKARLCELRVIWVAVVAKDGIDPNREMEGKQELIESYLLVTV